MNEEKVAIYARVSKADQDPTNQIKALTEWADKRGWVVVESYTDHGVSGSVPFTQRPGAEALLMDAHRGEFGRVLVFALDRLSRRGGKALNDTWGALEDRGLKVESLNESWASVPGFGELMRYISGWIAEDDLRRYSERIKAGMARSRAQGIVPGRPRTLGVDEVEISRLWVEGVAVAEIARRLDLSRSMVNRRLAEMKARGVIGVSEFGARWVA